MKNLELTTSAELDAVQKYLTAKLIEAVEVYDFKLVATQAVELQEIDIKRRDLWYKEKFGAYEEIADNVLGLPTQEDFPLDDIPF